ncbi:hypothetical protein PEPMIC_00015 [Parvimonas micra ATCC 33270]|uniref:Uncharacterized protein n=2 Tax=Parvimonas micra TaxID=33033 RepID=A8SI46_9FIRM|nr:hypothetical protein PEPMIC_00015 [Parvimonas micra ATCC 33270]
MKATDEYREDMDILGPYINENCIINPMAKVESRKLYDDYKKWCYQNDELELKNRSFYRQLVTRGFKKKRGTANKIFFYGIGLKKEQSYLSNSFSNSDKVTGINRKKL